MVSMISDDRMVKALYSAPLISQAPVKSWRVLPLCHDRVVSELGWQFAAEEALLGRVFGTVRVIGVVEFEHSWAVLCRLHISPHLFAPWSA